MIRLAKPSEIEKIMAITQACAQKMIRDGIYQWNEHYPNALAFEEDCSRQELYVLLNDNTLIGCITISVVKDDVYTPVKWLSEENKHYYIHRLAIDPRFQHQGHAKTLMDFAEALAKSNGIKSVRLDTFSKNVRNQKFYEARNYIRLEAIYFPNQSEFPFYCYEKIIS